MPVSYTPCCVPLLMIVIPAVLSFINWRAAAIGTGLVLALLVLFLLTIDVPGWRLHAKAPRGDPVAEYRYAQWLETHYEDVNSVLLFGPDPDTFGGYAWLRKAAAQNYGPAVWLVGARLKYGVGVPMPPGWTGPTGNTALPQPDAGQLLINHVVNDLRYGPSAADERSTIRRFYDRKDP